MSTSKGDPSRKMGWYRSMMDKLDNETQAIDKERKKNGNNHSKRPGTNKPEDKPATETP